MEAIKVIGRARNSDLRPPQLQPIRRLSAVSKSDVMGQNSLFSPSSVHVFTLRGEVAVYASLLLSTHSSPPPFSSTGALAPISLCTQLHRSFSLSSGTYSSTLYFFPVWPPSVLTRSILPLPSSLPLSTFSPSSLTLPHIPLNPPTPHPPSLFAVSTSLHPVYASELGRRHDTGWMSMNDC